jgi:hypothetical protein
VGKVQPASDNKEEGKGEGGGGEGGFPWGKTGMGKNRDMQVYFSQIGPLSVADF